MCKHIAKKFCKEWTKKRKFIKKMRLRKMSIIEDQVIVEIKSVLN